MIVEVFKTNVSDKVHAESLLHALRHAMLLKRASFDLDDCDKVLRVEGEAVCADHVIEMLSCFGFQCLLME